MDAPSVGRIGDYIKEQRENASLSLRRLAADAGVSNPYLSQVERGLRKPSAEILQQLAKALRISAEQLYVQAGLLDDKGASLAVETAVLGDLALSERQKRVLLDIYASFLHENGIVEEPPKGSRSPRRKSKSAVAKSAKRTAKRSAGKTTSKTTRKATSKASSKASSKKTASRKSVTKKTAQKSTRKRPAASKTKSS